MTTRRWMILGCTLALAAAPFVRATAQSKLELRAGAVTMLSQRAAMFEGGVGTGKGTMAGVELVARRRYVGLMARLFGGTFAAESGSAATGRVSMGDVRLLAGPRFLAAEIGYGRRGFTGAFGSRSWPVGRVGIRSALAIGGSGLSTDISVTYSLAMGGGDGTGQATGREAETRLIYIPPTRPIYVGLGYRHERFSMSSPSDTRPEEVSCMVLAAGVRLGR